MVDLRKSPKTSVKDVLGGLEAVIVSEQRNGHTHKVTPSEYFAAALSTILGNPHVEYIVEMIEVLEAVIPHTSVAILRSQFKSVTSLVTTLMRSNPEDKRLIKCSLGVMGSIMTAQETSDSFWSSVIALQSANCLLSYIDDSRDSVSKLAMKYITQLASNHKIHNCNALRSYITQFCSAVMSSCSRSEYRKSLLIIKLLENCLPYLSDSYKICKQTLRLQQCEQPMLTSAIFHMIDSFFQHPNIEIHVDRIEDFMLEFIRLQPNTTDMESNTYYFTALASSIVTLHKASPSSVSNCLSKVISILIQGCESEFTQIHCAIGTALKRIISTCLDFKNNSSNNMISPTTTSSEPSSLSMEKNMICIVEGISPVLQLRYQTAWLFVMDGIRCLFEKLHDHNEGKLKLVVILRQLVDIYQASNSQSISLPAGLQLSISDTISTALKSYGLAQFLAIIPLSSADTPAYAGIDEAREWLLSLFHSQLRPMRCSLQDFLTLILGCARQCSQVLKTNTVTLSLTDSQRSLARRRIIQLWSLFPDFCAGGPVDLPVVFPRLAKIIQNAIQDRSYPEFIPILTSGLTHLIEKCREKCPITSVSDTHDIIVLKQHAEMFLSMFVSLLEGLDVSDADFQPIVTCVGAWAEVSPPELLTGLAKGLIQRLLSSTLQSQLMAQSSASSWMSVMLVIIPYLPEQMITLLYRTIRPLLSIEQTLSLQKRSYLVLESILQKHGDKLHEVESYLSILSVITDSLLLTQVSARHMRLRCIEMLLEHLNPEELIQASRNVLAEILICQKDANKKTRDAAVSVLKHLIKHVPSLELLSQLCSGLVGETSLMRSSAVSAICMLLIEKRDDDELTTQTAQLLPSALLLLKEHTTEQTRACLTFTRVCVSVFPVEKLLPVLQVIVHATLTDLGPHKDKFAARARSIIRKLSQRVEEDKLRPLIPAEDQALLSYIQKQSRRTRRKKESRDEEKLRELLGSDDEGGDSSDDDETEDNDNGRTVRPRATRAMEVVDSFQVPSSLDDLLEDQPSMFNAQQPQQQKTQKDHRENKHRSQRPDKKGAPSPAEDSDDEEYTIKFTPDGTLVVEEKPYEKLPSETSKPSIRSQEEAATGQKSTKTEKDGSNKRKLKDPGEEYRSKRAGGDVWRRGMLEPHAYIPLDARLLSRKNQKEAVSYFGKVVNNGKRKNLIKAGGKARKGVLLGNRNQRQKAKKVTSGDKQGL